MATIKAIESRSVHQIQSGQVIVDLNSVCKELVENSLDAGATSIEIRFKNQGLDSIEVQDNGKGIAPDDFHSIALKHHTSKLSTYEDLDSLDTFGFRGEALSSLCALSKFHILTARAEDGPVGKRLDFDVSGTLKSAAVAAAQKGTTVYVEDLFHNLPVRRRELEKNIKREYQKVLGLMYSYACISTGVRFSVSNTMPKGKKMLVFSTNSNTTTRENITNVFGAKTTMALAKLDLTLGMAPTAGSSTQSAKTWSTQRSDRSMTVRVEGHVSKPVFGEGRQTPDRQMYFVNGRPCLLPQISKVFNEVYKGFNLSQSPFVFANLIMDTNAYDVNVSPDKRSIMLHDQAALLETLKAELTEMFEQTDHTVPQSQLPNRKLPAYQPLTIPRPKLEDALPSANCSEAEESEEDQEDDFVKEPPPRGAPAGSPTNLIHNWLDRGTELREESRQRSAVSTTADPTIVAQARQDSAPIAPMIAPSENGLEAEETSRQGEQRTSPGPAANPAASRDSPTIDATNAGAPETPIPAISTSSQKRAPGLVLNAFDRMRPKRTPLQTAEITVGNVTMTTTIGNSPPYKKRRICKPDDSQRVADYGASPSLAGGLRKSFAAPGSQLEIESSGLHVDGMPAYASESENEIEPDSSVDRAALTDQRRPPALSHMPTSDLLEDLMPAPADDDEWDEEYIDEEEKKLREDARVARLIQEAEEAAARPTELNLKRAAQVLKNSGNRKGSTLQLARVVQTTSEDIRAQLGQITSAEQPRCDRDDHAGEADSTIIKDQLDSEDAESRLSLIVTKPDFARMRIIGQFNMGFILAVRPGEGPGDEDDLFIIDQHAADEKYNYEYLQRTVTLQSQRLVRPKPLELNAIEEEIVLSHSDALKANGFEIEIMSNSSDSDETVPAGQRCRLLTLPMSKEKTFDLSDLEELLHLLSERPAGSSEVPRPKKVQRMLAMRACRSSIMVGKTLTVGQMSKVVKHMGEMEKPWNCPHGRPTMRHLAGLNAWTGWQEGHLIDVDQLDAAENAQTGRKTDWKAWLKTRV
ncbi:hypothetical protein CERZMDRAFT_39706 [Cercospora zeae-maydis SCOH1-5]|uniref:DNA mismatch repair protein PMS1 n=1 Tax=Cercospora zeae-maydis SCOH1-5 TaxID=717836 RepID=A0A6A6FIR5_9PEZI|nr:hypothetical protein CERZMDRAFT_39706 [Cercospora zeae-maydis SCOH1-5]